MKTKAIIVAIVVAIGLLFLGYQTFCAEPNKIDPRAAAAEKVWRENERIVKGALSGHAYSPDRFGDACAFFENVAGIKIRGRGTFFGWLPNESSAADFERVESWYSVNRGRLYWDEASRSVKVSGAKVTM